MPAIRIAAVPVGDSRKDTPSKASALVVRRTPGTPLGCGPEPLSIVSATSVALLALIRFVIGTFRNTLRLPVMRAPGVPPEQFMTRSPVRSVSPSDRITGGFALPAQVKIVVCASAAKHPSIRKRAIQDNRVIQSTSMLCSVTDISQDV